MPAEYNYSSVALETQLAGPVGPSDTVINVEATTGFPSVPFNLTLDPDNNEEIVTVTAVVGLALTVEREQDGTIAFSHQQGTKVKHQGIGRDLQRSRDHEAASGGVHGLAGDDAVAGVKATQTFENKTIDGTQNTVQNVPQSGITDLVSDQTTQNTRLVDAEARLDDSEGRLDEVEGRQNSMQAQMDLLPTIQVFTSSGTWTKPGSLKAVRVRVSGGGAQAGGASATGSGQASAGSGGQAGNYAESIIPAADLASSVSVTVGAGGTGGGAGNNGNNGGTSSFGAHVSAEGGNGGLAGGAGSTPITPANQPSPNTGGTGQIVVTGGLGEKGLSGGATARGGKGGDGPLGGGTRTSSTNSDGNQPTHGYGGGGSGGNNSASQGSARSGGDGRQGVVIVEHIY